MKSMLTAIVFACFCQGALSQQTDSIGKSSADTASSQLKMGNKSFKAILVWAVKEKGPSHDVITTAYTPWLTQQDAIDGITKMRGISWDSLQKEGAQLIQRKMFIEDKSDSARTR